MTAEPAALIATPGAAGALFVAPHATAPVDAAHPYILDDPEVRRGLAAHVEEWHDAGSGRALEACGRALSAPTLRNRLPRGLIDLNRGWRGRADTSDALFGKGALDAWCADHLAPGALERLERGYHQAMDQLAAASSTVRGMIEVHSFGDLGSTYQRLAGGRPMRRPEVAVVTTTPWATAFPVGLARLIPADLRGTPWALERRVGDAVDAVGLSVGPSPYPTTGPWSLSARFLAARWLAWLGRTGQLPAHTVDRLAGLAWHDEQDAELDAVAAGELEEPSHLEGVRELACRLSTWSSEGSELGDRFLREDDTFTLVVELRNDRVERASDFGAAVAEAVRGLLEGR